MPISQIIMARTASGGGGGGGGNTYPLPGSGSYQTFWPNSAGTPPLGSGYIPDGGVVSIDNPTAGWLRKTYAGIWSNTFSQGNDNPGLFDGAPLATDVDTFGGFGLTGGADNFAMEWKGYIRIFNTDIAVYNFLLDSDDVAMFWIGSPALNPDSNPPLITTNNSNQLNGNSVILSNGLYYPIRMRFQEWSGAERCQVFMGRVGSGSNLQAMINWTLTHNGNTGGY